MDKERILKFYTEYCAETSAYGAWGAHSPAQEYLDGLYHELQAILKDIHAVMKSNPFDQEDSDRKYQFYAQIKNMDVNYKELTVKVYKSDNMTSDDHSLLVEMIESEFLRVMGEGMKLLITSYEEAVGHSIDEDILIES